MTTERQIEKRLVEKVKERGGLCIKLGTTVMAGLPDRLVLLPFGIMAFVEVKRGGEEPGPLQRVVHKQLAELGFMVFVADSFVEVDNLIDLLNGKL